MKNLYSKSLMAAVAVMMLASCSNEEPNVNPQGKEQKVTIGMSVAGTKASSDDVNFGVKIQQIDNVVVVPMIGEQYQNPILFGNFTPETGAKVTKQTRTMSSLVNRFKVFGNVCDDYVAPAYDALKETEVFTGLTFKAPTWSSDAPEGGKTYSKPHELYYYYDTNGNVLNVSSGAWDDSEPSWTTASSIGEYKSVKINTVHYAVGVLAAMIKNGDVTTAFYQDEACQQVISSPWDAETAPISVTGITIAGQTEEFTVNKAKVEDGNNNLVASEKVVDVYEQAINGTLIKSDDDIESKISNSNRLGGNIYCIVAPTTAATVTLNIEFTVANNVYFKLADDTPVGNGAKLYLPVVLNKDLATGTGTATNIFEADKATFLNATVKNWGLASETPVETTDVTIGVEFDVDWAAGLQFDVEI